MHILINLFNACVDHNAQSYYNLIYIHSKLPLSNFLDYKQVELGQNFNGQFACDIFLQKLGCLYKEEPSFCGCAMEMPPICRYKSSIPEGVRSKNFGLNDYEMENLPGI